MKLSINWLKDYVDPKISTDELVHRLTMAGLEVETVETVGKDTALDLEITPNRPDCLNTIGLAREISAICAKNLKLPKVKEFKSSKASFSIAIDNKKDCPLYIGTLLKNTNVTDSPSWMRERLQSLGLRPISNAVDTTNFVLMEMGQPLHVFDFDKIEGGKIIVRRAKAGEKIITLDGIERKLDTSILVIADAKKPIAIAGIMGGMDTQVTTQTKNILLESAQFDLGIVRRGSRALGLKSDSSYRFERGIDISAAGLGANRATNTLIELTNGQIAGKVICGTLPKHKDTVIKLTIADIEDLLGTRVIAANVKSALTRLGLKVTTDGKNGFKIAVPSFRGDLKQKVDIIEEVARTIGYDRLDVSFPHIQVVNISPNSRPRAMKKRITDSLIAQGFFEIITYSLISQKDLDKSGLSALPTLTLHNALSNEHNILRPSLLPSMLSVAASNFHRGQKDLRLFEIGKRYFIEGEMPLVGMLAVGRRPIDWRNNTKDMIDFFDVKGVVEAVAKALGIEIIFEKGSLHTSMDKSACAAIMYEGKRIGTIGKIDKNVLQQWDIKQRSVFYAGLHLEELLSQKKQAVKYQPVSEFPGIARDISIAVKKDVAYKDIEQACIKQGGQMLSHVSLVEEYTGEKIQGDKRGLVLSLLYQSKERTLREEEVAAVHQGIVESLTKNFSATQR